MKSGILPWQLVLIVLALLLVRERHAGWMEAANDWWRTYILDATGLATDVPRVTFVSYGDATVQITQTPDIANLDAAIFLRTTLKYKPIAVGIVDPLEADTDQPFLTGIISRTPEVFLGQRLTREQSFGGEGPSETYVSKGTVPDLPEFRGAHQPLVDPADTHTGFINLPENITSERNAPLLGRLNGRVVGSLLFAGLDAGGLLIPGGFKISDGLLIMRNDRFLPVSREGTVPVPEGASERVQTISYDDFVLKGEQAELSGDGSELELLLADRIVLLGRNDEASRTFVRGNGERWSPARYWATAFAGAMSREASTRLPIWWEFFGPILTLVCLHLAARMKFWKAIVLFVSAAALLLVTTIILLAGANVYAPPLPALLIILIGALLRIGYGFMKTGTPSGSSSREPASNPPQANPR